MTTPLPTLNDVNGLFTMLFGHDTTCKQGKAPLPPDACAIVAIYNDKDGAAKRLLTCDLAFANSAGAALSMIPPGAAADATKAGSVPDNILANLHEVMNIAVNLFTETFDGRLELASVSRASELSPETKAALSSKERSTVDVAIPRYVAGRVGLVAV
ncbi:MAG: hypothetical protein NT013_20495 [Planctomycetia bacterium]|nr:hypothetical protein [Planctomycetia bacterium]